MWANRPNLAVRLARKSIVPGVSIQCAERYLLSGLWHILSFGTKVAAGSHMPSVLSDLLCLAGDMRDDLSPCGRDQVRQFRVDLLFLAY